MKRIAGRAWVAVAVVAMLVAMTQVADAQREGGRGRGGRGFGRGGGFGMTPVRLAEVDEVREVLALTDEQQDAVAQINDDLRDARGDLRDQDLEYSEVIREMERINQDASAKLAEALDEAQYRRLLGILAQVDVNAALSSPDIAKELGITDEQKEQLADIRQSNFDTMMDAFQEMQDRDLSRQERNAKRDDLRAEANKKLLAALSTEQQAQFEALKGEPVEIDMSQFRFGGRGGRGGRGGDGGRPDRGDREGRGGDGGDADRGA